MKQWPLYDDLVRAIYANPATTVRTGM
jgi:hypothetical protein